MSFAIAGAGSSICLEDLACCFLAANVICPGSNLKFIPSFIGSRCSLSVLLRHHYTSKIPLAAAAPIFSCSSLLILNDWLTYWLSALGSQAICQASNFQIWNSFARIRHGPDASGALGLPTLDYEPIRADNHTLMDAGMRVCYLYQLSFVNPLYSGDV